MGSNTRNKARILVAKAQEHVANARKDGLHKRSHRLVDENQVIAVEDLHVKGSKKLVPAYGCRSELLEGVCIPSQRVALTRFPA